jgi:hypothetical protein
LKEADVPLIVSDDEVNECISIAEEQRKFIKWLLKAYENISVHIFRNKALNRALSFSHKNRRFLNKKLFLGKFILYHSKRFTKTLEMNNFPSP